MKWINDESKWVKMEVWKIVADYVVLETEIE